MKKQKLAHLGQNDERQIRERGDAKTGRMTELYSTTTSTRGEKRKAEGGTSIPQRTCEEGQFGKSIQRGEYASPCSTLVLTRDLMEAEELMGRTTLWRECGRAVSSGSIEDDMLQPMIKNKNGG
ncbi:uncharacterized protein G2W53_024828 [Senna tora]|uniref:Uncharacterized protein n=1 Tax=Senna tora TaxID=362788 RepID=A0A834TBY0_9FABA|nr:uncharacterized protein G2W53_024828 [Senna tora]